MEIVECFTSKDNTQVIKVKETFLLWSWEYELHKKNGSIVKYNKGKYHILGLGQYCDARILFNIHFEKDLKIRPVTFSK